MPRVKKPAGRYYYHYPERDFFQSMMVVSGYAKTSAQVYATALVSDTNKNHNRAVRIWKKLMDGKPVPPPRLSTDVRDFSSTRRRSSPRRGTRDTPVEPTKAPEPNNEDPKLTTIKSLLALENISDTVKLQMISLLF